MCQCVAEVLETLSVTTNIIMFLRDERWPRPPLGSPDTLSLRQTLGGCGRSGYNLQVLMGFFNSYSKGPKASAIIVICTTRSILLQLLLLLLKMMMMRERLKQRERERERIGMSQVSSSGRGVGVSIVTLSIHCRGV